MDSLLDEICFSSSLQGFQDFLPQLVDQMAATTLQDHKPETITYDVIREKDVEQVMNLLKKTFFKASFPISSNPQML